MQVPKEALVPEAIVQVGSRVHRALSQLLTNVERTHIESRRLQVACGSRHTLFLSESNRVWAAGDNSRGQLGLGKNLLGDQALPRRVQALVG